MKTIKLFTISLFTLFVSLFSFSHSSYAATQTTHDTIDHIEYSDSVYWAVTTHAKTGEWVIPVCDSDNLNQTIIDTLTAQYKNKPVIITYDDNGGSTNGEDWTFIDAVIETN
jgi:hypothetical protein